MALHRKRQKYDRSHKSRLINSKNDSRPKEKQLPGFSSFGDSALALFKPSTEAVLKSLNTYILLLLVPAMYFLFVNLRSQHSVNSNHAHSLFTLSHNGTSLVLLLAGIIYSILVIAAVPYAQLRSAQGANVEYGDAIKRSLHYLPRILGLYIASGLAILFGLILFIIPGVILIGRLFFAPYFLIDKDLTIKEAILASLRTSRGHLGRIWAIIGVYILCSIPSIIPIAGNIASSVLQMLYSCAPALYYERLKSNSSE